MDFDNALPETAGILRHYLIKPYYVEDHGKIKRVFAQSGQYALKKIDPHHGIDFIRNLQFLYQKGYNRLVPIFPTADGRYAVYENNALYYLMPWLSNVDKEDRDERPRQMFRELARLHTISAREVEVSDEDRKKHYEKTIAQWEKDEEFIDGFIELCENEWYMSPFQLTFCLYYNHIRQAMGFAKGKFTQWHEKTKDEKKSRMVLLHGNLSTEHFLYDDNGYGYFTNFQRSKFGSPIHDLLPFLSRHLKVRLRQADDCVDWVSTYFNYFPLKEEERLLFLSYLAYPTGLLRTVEEYHMDRGKVDERRFAQRLQKHYWHLKNTEYVAMRLEEIERQKKQAQEAAKKQAEQEGAQGE